MSHADDFLDAAGLVCNSLDGYKLEELAAALSNLRGRLFILGVGGSAANASHAVNDFRKLCHIEAYAPTDNVAELTARTNDEGWATVFSAWLRSSEDSGDLQAPFGTTGKERSRQSRSIPLLRVAGEKARPS